MTLVFLGRLEDLAGTQQRTAAPGPLADIIASLEPELAAALQAERIRIAVNGELVADRAQAIPADGDEVAFLPPVSGG